MSRYNGEIPDGASIEANIREMHEYRITHGYRRVDILVCRND